MSERPPYLAPHEHKAGLLIDPVVAPLKLQMRQIAEMLRGFGSVAEEQGADDPAGRVQSILLPRCADDLNATIALASLGYEQQSLALAATVYEIGFLTAFIGFDSERAQKWLDWKIVERMPWSALELTKGGLRNADSDAMPAKVYTNYQAACAAKHGNPRLLRSLKVAPSLDRRIHNANPKSPGSGATAMMAFLAAGAGAMTAAAVFVDRCEFSEEEKDRIESIFLRWAVFVDLDARLRHKGTKRQ